MTELLFKLFPFLGQPRISADKKPPKKYPFSSKRQEERYKRQGLYEVKLPLNGRHNSIIQTTDSHGRKLIAKLEVKAAVTE